MAELPQPRNVDLLLVSEVNVPSPCCSCGKKDGVLKCSGCKAVTYCGEECREKGRNNHDQICNTINQLLLQVKEAIEDLANQYGGVEKLLEAPLVKDGLFRYRDNYESSEDPRNFLCEFFINHQPTVSEKYDIARWKLINAYAKCGKETLSGLAFRLAAENWLYMLRLCPTQESRGRTYFILHKYCGWMVAGGMDQQALNILSYVISGEKGHVFLDLSLDEDIEGVSLVQIIKEKIPKTTSFITPRMWNHDFMLISLIKYKRIQALAAQRREEEEQWNTFMEGTQSSYGEIIRISGMSPVMVKLKRLVVDKSVGKRVNLLTNQINDLLNEVNERNPKLIPGILYGHVDNPTFAEAGNSRDFLAHYHDYGTSVKNDIQKARYGVGKYGHAWHIDKDCTSALKLFLETGNVMPESTSIPTSDPSGKDTNGGGTQCD